MLLLCKYLCLLTLPADVPKQRADGSELLDKVIIEEAIEEGVGAGGGHSNKMAGNEG